MNPLSHPNGIRRDAFKPPFDAEGFLQIMQARSDIIETNQICGLARSMGVLLTADHVDDLLKQLLEGQNPRVLMYKGEKIPPNVSSKGAVSWYQLVARVPVKEFRDIGDIEIMSTLGLLYQCDIDGYRVEITEKARKLVELLQLTHQFSPSRGQDSDLEGFFADDFKREVDIALKEAANGDEAVKYAIYIQKCATDYRDKMLQHAERHRKLAPELCGVADTDNEEVSAQEPAQEPDISDSESDINSILNDPTGDIPYRSPSSQRDGNLYTAMEEDERPHANGHTQPSLASLNRSVLAHPDRPAYSEGSSDGNDSDIPFLTCKGGKPLPPTEEEKRDGEEFVAAGRLAGLEWGRISQIYTRRFRIRRSTQYLVNKYPQYRDVFIKGR